MQLRCSRGCARGARTADSLNGKAKLKTENVYAAPGEPVILQQGKVGSYDGKAAKSRPTRASTTLLPK
ncbi:hypothetical protein AUC43_06175 [Hymenobacter sedentarius]|uniref:Uncharacterized protein n=1 Tax=Hymenobacter sedentarius TaxID=1411621 RepID=A0A0U3JVS5_9BACT|nr:hypothetical protein [Hymenobacter sedentarius]ALW84703.1 hypothetical protein AUC43_06175 [Hymenobacter sedentarius]